MGCGHRNAIYAVTITVAIFALNFTKSEYVSVGSGDKTEVMGGQDEERNKGIQQLLLKKRENVGI